MDYYIISIFQRFFHIVFLSISSSAWTTSNDFASLRPGNEAFELLQGDLLIVVQILFAGYGTVPAGDSDPRWPHVML